MGADKIELIYAAFLFKDASIKVVHIKRQKVRTFQFMDFQRGMLRIFLKKGYLFFEFLPDFFWKFIILGQKVRFYCYEIFTQSLLSSSPMNASISYFFDFPA